MRSGTLAILLAFFSVLASGTASADAGDAAWNLPAAISDANTEVSFEVDSTWHTVHGKTDGVKGKLWLDDPTDPTSIRGEIEIPVKTFDTDNSSRDERLREVMQEPAHSSVKYVIDKVEGICLPETLSTQPSCEANALGKLNIIDHEESIPLKLKVIKKGEAYVVTGTSNFSWRLFPIEDPSIIIARLYDDVSVKFRVTLAKAAAVEPQTTK